MQKNLYLMQALLLALVVSNAWAGKPGANQAPTVSLSSPVAGATFAAPATIALNASASDSDGSIAKVEFYRGTTLIGTDTTAPYSVAWSNAGAGSYSLSAKAFDNVGASASSTSVAITITASSGNVSITSPVNGMAAYGGHVMVTGSFTGDAATTVLVDNGSSSRLATLNGATFSAGVPVYPGPNTLTVTVARSDKTFDKATVSVVGREFPLVVLQTPNTNAFMVPTDIVFEVDAKSPGGNIARVEFYKNDDFLGSVTAPPYRSVWSNVGAGSYTFYAKAFDDNGFNTSKSLGVYVTGPNTLPTVTLSAPVNGARYTALATIELAATAGDADGSITMVEFWRNGSLIGSTNVSPYKMTWRNVFAGSYSVLAKATDNRGGVTSSAPVTVTVVEPNAPPTVAMTSPASGASFYAPANIALSANADDSDGSIVQVEFWDGLNILGIDATAPYTLDWRNVPAGSYSITASTSDNQGGHSASAPVAVTVAVQPNAAPTVSLTSPTNNSMATAPATIALSANASDSDGSIAKVEFFTGANLLATVTSAPYSYQWSSVAVGNYAITAQATDNLGAVTTSAPVAVTVQAPLLTVTSPAEGAALNGNMILVQGTYQGEANTGITVNGVVAALADNHTFYAHVPLQAGANTLTATMTAQSGATATQTLTVSSDGVVSPLQVEVDQVQGLSPLTVKFRLKNTLLPNTATTPATDNPLTVQVNNGAPVTLIANQEMSISSTMTGASVRYFTFIATDAQNQTTTQTFAIVVNDPVQADLKFKALWNGMNDALIAGDKTKAMTYLSAPAQAIYGPAMDALQAEMAQIVASYSAPLAGVVSADIGEYVISRSIDGVDAVFFIYYQRGSDGVWRLESM